MRTDTISDTPTTGATIPRLLDCAAACAAIGGEGKPISRATLYRLTKAGLLKVHRPAPGVVRWSAEDIAVYLNSVQFPKKVA